MRVVGKVAAGFLVLADDRRRDRPLIVEIDLEGRRGRRGVHRVEILLHDVAIVDGDGGVIGKAVRSPVGPPATGVPIGEYRWNVSWR